MTIFAVFVAVIGAVRRAWRERDEQWLPDTAERRQIWARTTDDNMRID